MKTASPDRVRSAFGRRRILVTAAAVVVSLVLAGLLVYRTHWWIRPYRLPELGDRGGRVPAKLVGERGVRNDGLGFWFEMTPAHPTGGLLCRYQANEPLPDRLLGSVSLPGA